MLPCQSISLFTIVSLCLLCYTFAMQISFRFELANRQDISGSVLSGTAGVSVLSCYVKCYHTASCNYIAFSSKDKGSPYLEGSFELLTKKPRAFVDHESHDTMLILMPLLEVENAADSSSKVMIIRSAKTCKDYCQTEQENGVYWFDHPYTKDDSIRIPCACYGEDSFGTWSKCEDGGWWWGCSGNVGSKSPLISMEYKKQAIFLSEM